MEEFDDDDEEGEAKLLGTVRGSSSMEFDATTRSRSLRTSRTVR